MHNGQEITLTITHLGGLGDGVAEMDGQVVFVPFAAPGDRVRAVVEQAGKDFIRARLVEVMEPGPQRQPAACAHFGVCGGCVLQHVTPEAYREFKRGILLHAIRRAGYDPACVKDIVVVGEGARRRAEFGVSVHKGEVTLGFSEARSHRIENVVECPVLHPAILALLPKLRDAIARLRKPGQVRGVFVTETEKGLDLSVTFAVPPAASERDRLTAFAMNDESIVRLCLREAEGGITPVFERSAVEQRCGNTYVEIPPGAVLQATETAVHTITGILLQALEGYRSVAD
ncbi:MAG: class I SAM-dependent RNA methyltransferase, partial [Alphaproteobacteria bacterium]|nr:class I SAM-dependent RNA methyltransferase [Alphaproteobacteria bacterium]